MFFVTKWAFGVRLKFCAFRLLQFGLVGALSFVMFAAPTNNAVAQFPGVGSEAPSGEVTQAYDGGVSSGAGSAKNSVSGVSNSDGDGSKSTGTSAISDQSDGNDKGVNYQPPDSRFSTSMLKKEQHRKQLFIKRLRFEFAAIELVERKTGLPFSRDDVPRYLDELRSDLKTIVGKEENGLIVRGGVRSIARDANHIETQLNQHIDQLLNHLGRPVPKKPFFAMMPVLPETTSVAGKKLSALALKSELADYGEKVLQAMGTKRY